MRYERMRRGRFLARPNRFIAHVDLDGETAVVHVKNTGRCRELLVPGAPVWVQEADNPARKTRWDLIAVRKGERLINMDAQAPNRVFREWAAAGHFRPDLRDIRPEFPYGGSRFDFRLETAAGVHFVEVKGVTLEEAGAVFFPDAPTERGVKHLRELQSAAAAGYGATVFFVVQMENVRCFSPNDRTHPAFGAALRAAVAAGVRAEAWDCRVEPDRLEICRPVKIVL